MEYTIQKYKEAVEAWRKAVDELDQAHAVLRDIKLHREVQSGSGPYRATVDSCVETAFELLVALESYTCDECGKPIDHIDHTNGNCTQWTK